MNWKHGVRTEEQGLPADPLTKRRLPIGRSKLGKLLDRTKAGRATSLPTLTSPHKLQHATSRTFWNCFNTQETRPSKKAGNA